jgi:hypothetical protein
MMEDFHCNRIFVILFKCAIVLQDVTYHFEEYASLQEDKALVRNYERMIEALPQCSSAQTERFSCITLLAFLLLHLILV